MNPSATCGVCGRPDATPECDLESDFIIYRCECGNLWYGKSGVVHLFARDHDRTRRYLYVAMLSAAIFIGALGGAIWAKFFRR